MHPCLPASLVLALVVPAAVAADPGTTPSELSALRQEIAALRAGYEARLQQLEQRLAAAERATARPAETAAPAPALAPAVTPALAATSDPATAPLAAPAGGGVAAFNPALSLILSGLYTRSSRDPAQASIRGYALPPDAEIGPGERGFSLSESELGIAASIDPWLRGSAAIALHADDSVAVEEAYVQTTALGQGLGLKAGRFYSAVGYLNAKHAHSWDFVDNPLAYQALLGTQYADDGVQLSWLSPTEQYLEFNAEVGRGRGFPGNAAAGNGAGMTALAAHSGGDIGLSQSWRAGLSWLRAKADDQALLDGEGIASSFSGRTRLWIADAVWKWAPNGNATRTSLSLQGEYLRGRRSGRLTVDDDHDAGAQPYRALQSGWYVQGLYQFQPRWRLGLRSEALRADDGARPRKDTLMLDYSPSEFARFRLQFADDRSRPGDADRQFFLQYITSLGAHGAHGY